MSEPRPVLQHALAIDSSTEQLSLALAPGPLPLAGATHWGDGAVLSITDSGGAKASLNLLGHVQALLHQAGLQAHDLGCIAYGRGPGAFTGLRTACAVAQGLGFAHNIPVVGVGSLMCIAQAARHQRPDARRITALLDARMDELYSATFVFDGALIPTQVPVDIEPPALVSPDDIADVLPDWQPDTAAAILAGNTEALYGGRWAHAPWQAQHIHALPHAKAMLELLPALWAAGLATDAAHATPLYVRDRVALTTAERAAKAQA